MVDILKEFAGQNYSTLLIILLVTSSLNNDRVVRELTEGVIHLLAQKKILEASEVTELYSRSKKSLLSTLVGDIL